MAKKPEKPAKPDYNAIMSDPQRRANYMRGYIRGFAKAHQKKMVHRVVTGLLGK